MKMFENLSFRLKSKLFYNKLILLRLIEKKIENQIFKNNQLTN